MSEWHVEVVRLGPITKHENADTLGITMVHGGYPVIVRLGDYAEGDLAVYVPVDSVVPGTEEWAFLGSSRRVKAKRLRGVFSMGLLTKAPPDATEGDDVAEALGIVKWEPEIETITTRVHGNTPKPPSGPPLPVYDIDALRKYSAILAPGEDVVITEKVHGANARFMHDGERLHVGSRNLYRNRDGCKLWWPVAEALDLEAKLGRFPRIALYGEVYGNVQDLKYGKADGAAFVAFDVYDSTTGRWWDFDVANAFVVGELGVSWVPVLYRGAWSESLRSLAEGLSTIPGANHVREGIVVRPTKERWHDRLGRVQLKLHGEGYLTRKSA